MTWEEKIELTNKKIAELLGISVEDNEKPSCYKNKIFGNYCCCNSDRKGILLKVIKSVEHGEIEIFKENVEKLKNQYEALRLAFKTFTSYKGPKKLNYIGVLTLDYAGCGLHLKLYFEDGMLILNFPEHIMGRKTPEKILLYISRLINFGERKCLKHPRHRKIKS